MTRAGSSGGVRLSTILDVKSAEMNWRMADMRRLAAVTMVAASLSVAQQDTPSLDSILEHYAQALGGRSEFEKVTSLELKGTIEFPERKWSGTTTEYFQAPQRFATVIEIPSFGKVRTVSDGTRVWSSNPQSGVSEITGTEKADMIRRSDLMWHIKLKEYYPGLRVTGHDSVDGRAAWVLEAALEGRGYRWYFDQETGELVRFDTDGAQPGDSSTVLIGDYRPVGKLRFAFRTSFSSAKLKWNRTLSEVQFNVAIDPAVFAKP